MDDFDFPQFETLDGSATLLHEMYEGFVRAGFNEEQAFKLLLTMVAIEMSGGPLQ